MKANLFSKDITTDKPLNVTPGEPISEYAAIIGVSDDPRVIDAGRRFSAAIDDGFVSDFEKRSIRSDSDTPTSRIKWLMYRLLSSSTAMYT